MQRSRLNRMENACAKKSLVQTGFNYGSPYQTVQYSRSECILRETIDFTRFKVNWNLLHKPKKKWPLVV